MLPQFGPFASVFGARELSSPGHLALLGPRADARIMFDRVQQAWAEPQSAAGVKAMLQERNWRPHLVAGVALLLEPLGSSHSGLLEALWGALERGSWVSPQLVVVASLCDPSFAERSAARLREGCPVRLRSETDAAGQQGRGSGKEAAALIAVRQQLDPPLLEPSSSHPELQGCLADSQGGGEIASRWKQGIEAHLAAHRSPAAD